MKQRYQRKYYISMEPDEKAKAQSLAAANNFMNVRDCGVSKFQDPFSPLVAK
jgi:hypothetical protein